MSTPQAINILDALPGKAAGEITTGLLAHSGVRIERIVSTGQATLEDAPYVQAHDEWVLLLAGAAGLLIDADRLRPGDCVLIPANRRHWVTWTAPKSRRSGWRFTCPGEGISTPDRFSRY